MSDVDTFGHVVRFPGWEIRPAERALIVADARIADLDARAFDVLRVLVDKRGRLVTKDEFFSQVWADLVVEPNNLTVHISALRKVLPEGTILTRPKLGYQLSAIPIGAAPLPSPAAETRPATTPHATARLLGRDDDRAGVLDQLHSHRLVTIVGTGGVGKTALAHTVFEQRGDIALDNGVWVDLAPVQDPRQVLPIIAKQLGVQLVDTEDLMASLVASLAEMTHLLVVLDNCEHVLTTVAPFIALALDRATGVRWMVTSQVSLHVEGECLYRLGPLRVPGQLLPPIEAVEYGAVALLCARLAQAGSNFRLDHGNVETVIALCRQLDGLPLAIEMAAARVANLGLPAVLRLLGQRLKLLARKPHVGGYRHDTLQATYDWSYGLLEPIEQAVFRRLEPFLGGFRTEVAQEVVRDEDPAGPVGEWNVLDALDALIDKSLVQRSIDDPERLYLLESARDYARARLIESDEASRVRQAHARAMARRVADAEADAMILDDVNWLARYAPERHNVLTAIRQCVADGLADELAQLVTVYALADWISCRQAEILHCEIPMDLLAQARPHLRAQAWLELAWANFSDGDHGQGLEQARNAATLLQEVGDAALTYRALGQLTRLLEGHPDLQSEALAAWEAAQRLRDRVMPTRIRIFCASSAGLYGRPELDPLLLQHLGSQAHEAGLTGIAAICGCNLTDKLVAAGRFREAVDTAHQLLHLYGEANRACAFILHNMTFALIRLGRFEEAREAAQRSFRAMPSVAHYLVAAFALGATMEGRMADAAVLHGCAAQARRRLNLHLKDEEARSIIETQDHLVQSLPQEILYELTALGAATTPSDALALKVFSRLRTHPARDVEAAAPPNPAFSRGVPIAS